MIGASNFLRRFMHAKLIIAKLGGQTTLAAKLGKGQSTVAYWAKTGVIPAKWQPILLQLATKESVALSAGDFVSSAELAPDLAPVDARAFDPAGTELTATAPQGVADADTSPFLFYTADGGAVKVRVMVEAETVWATQRGLSEIFCLTVSTVSHHLRQIFDTRE